MNFKTQVHRRWQRFHSRLTTFYGRHPLQISLLLGLLFCGSYLRLKQLGETVLFQGDQGRDALLVARVFREWDPVFIGPVTSIGNMYLGPFYYYFMLPFLLLTYPNPLGPAIGVALVSIFFIGMIYVWGRKLVGERAALWAAFLYTFSAIGITYARFSWNPNLSPIFSFLTLYLIHKSFHAPRYLPVLALVLGLLIQLHYVNLIMVIVAGIFYGLSLWRHRRVKNWYRRKRFGVWSFLAAGIFLLTLVPLILFDLKHDFPNTQAVVNLFAKEGGFTPAVEQNGRSQPTLYLTYQNLYGRLGHLFTTLLVPKSENLGQWGVKVYPLRVSLGVGLVLLFALFTFLKRRSPYRLSYSVLLVTGAVSVLALALYQHSVYDHYVLFFLPVLHLLIGCLLATLAATKLYPLLALGVGLIYGAGNYQGDLFQPVEPTVKQATQLVKNLLTIIPPTASFSFVLINDQGDYLGEHYRYYFEALSPNLIPMALSHTADYLFVIDETTRADLMTSPSHELQVFLSQSEATYSALPNGVTGARLYLLTKVKYDEKN